MLSWNQLNAIPNCGTTLYQIILRAVAAAVAAQILLENFFRKHKFIDVNKPRLGIDDVRNAKNWVYNTYSWENVQ